MIWSFFVIASLPVLALLLCQRDRKLESQILTVLLRYGEMYGLQIIDAIEEDFARNAGFGAVYPTLRRLERDGFVITRWGEEQPWERGGERIRYYRLTGKRFRIFDHKLSGEFLSSGAS